MLYQQIMIFFIRKMHERVCACRTWDFTMNAEIKGKPACYVWGVETDDGSMTVRDVSASYEEMMKRIGRNGRIRLPPECDGVCDVLPATPELCEEIRIHGTGVSCRLVEQDGEWLFDVIHT